MSVFVILFACFQACLIQTVFSQYLLGPYGPGIAGPAAYECGSCRTPAAIATYPGYAAYGGEGVGDVAVAGEIGVTGTTVVTGRVPILGAVQFDGLVPAAGTVTIKGGCGCGCRAGYGPFAAPFGAAPFGAGPFAAGPFAAAPIAAVAPIVAAAPIAAAVPVAFDIADVAASNGGGLEVASGSAIPPSGVSIISENLIEGALEVVGALPFLGTVGLEGALPTAGAGGVNYGCGNGAVTILAEDVAPLGIANPLGCGAGPLGGFYSRAGYGCGAFI